MVEMIKSFAKAEVHQPLRSQEEPSWASLGIQVREVGFQPNR